MSQQILADGYAIQPGLSHDTTVLRVGEETIAAALPNPSGNPDDTQWRVIWFDDTNCAGSVGALVGDEESALAWLHRIGQTQAKAVKA